MPINLPKEKTHKLYSLKRAAEILGVSKDTLRRWEKAGLIESIRTAGGHRRYTQEQIKLTKFKKAIPKPSPPVLPENIYQPPLKEDYPLYTPLIKKLHINQKMALFVFLLLCSLSLNLALFSKYKIATTSKEGKVSGTNTEGQVLQAATETFNRSFNVYIPSAFRNTVTFTDDITASGAASFVDLSVSGTLSSPGDLTLDPAGGDVSVDGNLTLSDTFVLRLGGVTTGAYHAIANSTDAKDESNVSADNDLYIGGDLEVDGSIYGALATSPDATTLDGIDSTSFLRSDTSDSYTSGTLTFSDATFLDLSAIVHNDTALQGLRLPQATSLTNPTSGEGFLAWDSDDNSLQIYSGSSWDSVGLAGSGTSGQIAFWSATTTVSGDAGLTYNSTTDILTVGSGGAINPALDLGADLGSSSLYWNNLYVANINTNSTLSTEGQALFTYDPADTTFAEASVLINPTAPAANEWMLGIGQGGKQRAGVDSEGDLILGYDDAASAPSNSYPLSIYNHGSTNIAYIDTSGNQYLAGTLTATDLSCTDCLEQGNIASSAIGQGELITDTGSQTGTGGASITMNAYNFFPNYERGTCAEQAVMGDWGGDAANDQIGRFRANLAPCGTGTWAARWRYITASDHPTIWVITNVDGSMNMVWQSDDPVDPFKYPENPNPLAGNLLKSGQGFVNPQPLSVSQLSQLFAQLPSSDQQAIANDLKEYLVEKRGWLSDFQSISDLDAVSERYHPSGRFWTMRLIADYYKLDPAELIQNLMVINPQDQLELKEPFGQVLSDYLVFREQALARNAQQAADFAALPEDQKNADLAEWYSIENNSQEPKPGELVSIGVAGSLIKTQKAYDPKLLGVVSTSSHTTLGEKTQNNDIKLTLSGRVPVKIASSSAEINPGDNITSSSEPGKGMKAEKYSKVVGQALEPWKPESGQVTILVFISPGYFVGEMNETGYLNLDKAVATTDIKIEDKNNLFARLFNKQDSENSETDEAGETDLKENLTDISLSESLDEIVSRIETVETDVSLLKNQALLASTSASLDSQVVGSSSEITVLADTVINGKLNVGLLTLDNFENSIDVAGTLQIQPLALGPIEFFNGQIKMDPEGNLTTKELTAEKYNIAGASAGSAQMKAGETKVWIESEMVNDSSMVFVTAKTLTQQPLVVTKKESGRFQVEMMSSQTQDIDFDWWVVDKAF